MYRLSCEGGKVHDGTRLLLPTRCPKLLQLVLIHGGINDAILDDMLPHYPKLIALSLDDNPVEGKNLSILCHCPHLSTLSLSKTRISNETIKLMLMLFMLELDLSGSDIDGSTLFEHGVPPTLGNLRLE